MPSRNVLVSTMVIASSMTLLPVCPSTYACDTWLAMHDAIEDQWDEAHPNLVEHAIEKGWAENKESFNFARDYGDYWRKDTKYTE